VAPLIPETPDDVTPEWLTAVLAEAGALRAGRVSDSRWERVGQDYGFTGLVGRVELRYEDTVGRPPSSVIVKLPMARGETVSGHRALQERDPALMRRYFERCTREERFYRELGATFAPRPYYTAADDASLRVVLVLEDLTSGRQGDVLLGCSVDDVALVIDEVAPFHARWWGDRAPAGGFPRSGSSPQDWQARYARQAGIFIEQYPELAPPAFYAIVRKLRSRLAHVTETLHARHETLTHSDLHLDNMIFDGRGAGRSVAVLDWQTVSVGPPAWDVAMLLYGSLDVADRRSAEGDLLDRYVNVLSAHGVRDYSTDDLSLECGLALLLLLAGTVGWQATVGAEATDRERELQRAAIADGRLVSAVLDHAADALG
jgi:Phosphotransferase enzyme family